MSSFVAGQILTASALNTEFAAVPPIGSVIMWAGATSSLPTGWIMCDGSSQSTSGTYANLFTTIQYRYGGSGATFYLPKLNASYVPIGTSTLNTDGSRQTTTPSLTVSTSNVGSSGHAHTFNFTLNNHASTGHNHTIGSAGNSGNQSSNHQHNFTTAGRGAFHSHSYLKSNTSNIGATTGNDGPDHTHNGSTSIQGLDTNHTHPVVFNATTADTGHAHTVATSTWATPTADNTHAHTVPASFMVFIIRYA
jgi:hypothetical protein